MLFTILLHVLQGIKLGQVWNASQAPNTKQVYRLQLQDNASVPLTFILQGQDQNLLFSGAVTFKDTEGNLLYQCVDILEIICNVPPEYLKSKKQIDITILCTKICTIQFVAIYLPPVNFKQTPQVSFQQTYAKNLEYALEKQDLQADELVFQFIIYPFSNKLHRRLLILSNHGLEFPSSPSQNNLTKSKPAIPIDESVVGIRYSKNQIKNSKSIKITILGTNCIIMPTARKVIVKNDKAFVYIKQNYIGHELMLKGQQLIYQIQLESIKEGVLITAHTFSGQVQASFLTGQINQLFLKRHQARSDLFLIKQNDLKSAKMLKVQTKCLSSECSAKLSATFTKDNQLAILQNQHYTTIMSSPSFVYKYQNRDQNQGVISLLLKSKQNIKIQLSVCTDRCRPQVLDMINISQHKKIVDLTLNDKNCKGKPEKPGDPILNCSIQFDVEHKDRLTLLISRKDKEILIHQNQSVQMYIEEEEQLIFHVKEKTSSFVQFYAFPYVGDISIAGGCTPSIAKKQKLERLNALTVKNCSQGNFYLRVYGHQNSMIGIRRKFQKQISPDKENTTQSGKFQVKDTIGQNLEHFVMKAGMFKKNLYYQNEVQGQLLVVSIIRGSLIVRYKKPNSNQQIILQSGLLLTQKGRYTLIVVKQDISQQNTQFYIQIKKNSQSCRQGLIDSQIQLTSQKKQESVCYKFLISPEYTYQFSLSQNQFMPTSSLQLFDVEKRSVGENHHSIVVQPVKLKAGACNKVCQISAIVSGDVSKNALLVQRITDRMMLMQTVSQLIVLNGARTYYLKQSEVKKQKKLFFQVLPIKGSVQISFEQKRFMAVQSIPFFSYVDSKSPQVLFHCVAQTCQFMFQISSRTVQLPVRKFPLEANQFQLFSYKVTDSREQQLQIYTHQKSKPALCIVSKPDNSYEGYSRPVNLSMRGTWMVSCSSQINQQIDITVHFSLKDASYSYLRIGQYSYKTFIQQNTHFFVMDSLGIGQVSLLVVHQRNSMATTQYVACNWKTAQAILDGNTKELKKFDSDNPLINLDKNEVLVLKVQAYPNSIVGVLASKKDIPLLIQEFKLKISIKQGETRMLHNRGKRFKGIMLRVKTGYVQVRLLNYGQEIIKKFKASNKTHLMKFNQSKKITQSQYFGAIINITAIDDSFVQVSEFADHNMALEHGESLRLSFQPGSNSQCIVLRQSVQERSISISANRLVQFTFKISDFNERDFSSFVKKEIFNPASGLLIFTLEPLTVPTLICLQSGVPQLQFSITVADKNINFISLQDFFLWETDKEGLVFQMPQVPVNKHLIVEGRFCQEKLRVFQSDSFQKLKSRSKQLQNWEEGFRYSWQNGRVFLRVEGDQLSHFLIRAVLTEQQIGDPYKNVYIQNAGTLQYKSGIYYLQLPQVVIKGKQPTKVQIQINAFHRRSQAHHYRTCSLGRAIGQLNMQLPLQESAYRGVEKIDLSRIFDLKAHRKVYIVNVIKVYYGEQVFRFQEQVLKIVKNEESEHGYWMWVAVPLLFVALWMGYRRFKRTRRTDRFIQMQTV